MFFGQLRQENREVREVPVSMQLPMGILALLCVFFGLFPVFAERVLLIPAVASAFDAKGYILSMQGGGTGGFMIPEVREVLRGLAPGCWEPMSWLLLLLMVSCAVCLALLIGAPGGHGVSRGTAGPVQGPGAAPESANGADGDVPDVAAERMASYGAKYDSFFSGEQAEFSQVGGSDLFWGFKQNWRHYFRFMRRWHSGSVNDYVRYGIAAIAFALVFAAVCL